MASKITSISDTGDAIIILIKYGNQSKPINITQKDDLFSIESKMQDRFKFNSQQIKALQLQYYDDDLKEFVDLDNGTWPKYTSYLQYGENKADNGAEQHLKLVHKQLFRQYNNTEGSLAKCLLRRT